MLPKDKGMVGAFNDKIEFFPATFTHDRDKLIRSLRDLDFGNPTRLYDAIAAEHGSSSRGRWPARRARVHRRRRHRQPRLTAAGARTGAPRRSDDLRGGPAERLLQRLASGAKQARWRAEAAGRGDRRRLLRARNTSDLAPTFTRVAQELHSQYVLGFTPTVLDGKLHRVHACKAKLGMIRPRAKELPRVRRIELPLTNS